jgi:hypothetical protein
MDQYVAVKELSKGRVSYANRTTDGKPFVLCTERGHLASALVAPIDSIRVAAVEAVVSGCSFAFLARSVECFVIILLLVLPCVCIKHLPFALSPHSSLRLCIFANNDFLSQQLPGDSQVTVVSQSGVQLLTERLGKLKRFSESDSQVVFRQMVEAVHALHTTGHVHGFIR